MASGRRLLLKRATLTLGVGKARAFLRKGHNLFAVELMDGPWQWPSWSLVRILNSGHALRLKGWSFWEESAHTISGGKLPPPHLSHQLFQKPRFWIKWMSEWVGEWIDG